MITIFFCISKINLSYLYRKTPLYLYLLMKFTRNLILMIRMVILSVYLTRAIKLVLLSLCLAVYIYQMRMLCMLCQLNIFNLRIYQNIIISLEETGFQVLSIITDNNAVNTKTISFFCSLSKLLIIVMKSRTLFFLFDSVHLLKCIRNNWKDASKFMLFPKFCHNENHELDCIENPHFVPYSNLILGNFSRFPNIVINWP